MGADPTIPHGGAMKTNMELIKHLFVQKEPNHIIDLRNWLYQPLSQFDRF
jgi:hypothetical protein